MAFKQQRHRRQNKAHRHLNILCERISGRWKDHHQVCEVRRQRGRHLHKEYNQHHFSKTPRETSLGQERSK